LLWLAYNSCLVSLFFDDYGDFLVGK